MKSPAPLFQDRKFFFFFFFFWGTLPTLVGSGMHWFYDFKQSPKISFNKEVGRLADLSTNSLGTAGKSMKKKGSWIQPYS